MPQQNTQKTNPYKITNKINFKEVRTAKEFDKIGGLDKLMLSFPYMQSGINGVLDVRDNLGRGYILFVAVHDGRPVGYVLCNPSRQHDKGIGGKREGFYISEIFMDEVYRGKDIGQYLARLACSRAKNTGRGSIFAEIEVGNSEADNFFRDLGFTEKKKIDYGKNNVYSIMSRALSKKRREV